DQLVHAPVGPNPTFDWTTAPLTTRLAARLLDVPLAYPISRVAVPPEPAVIVNCAAAPEAFSVLQNPVPENPACSDSIAPSQVAGEFSASYRPSGGGVDGVGSVGVGLVGVDGVGERSEERRVGKGCGSGWSRERESENAGNRGEQCE